MLLIAFNVLRPPVEELFIYGPSLVSVCLLVFLLIKWASIGAESGTGSSGDCFPWPQHWSGFCLLFYLEKGVGQVYCRQKVRGEGRWDMLVLMLLTTGLCYEPWERAVVTKNMRLPSSQKPAEHPSKWYTEQNHAQICLSCWVLSLLTKFGINVSLSSLSYISQQTKSMWFVWKYFFEIKYVLLKLLLTSSII